ncbi:MAG: hypothetical protein BZ137_08660, partial [Methanosphaera sp. rholeuAM130]
MDKNTKLLVIISLVIILMGIGTASANEINPIDGSTSIQDTPTTVHADPQYAQENLNASTDTKEVSDTSPTTLYREEKNIKEATYTVDSSNIGRYFDLEDGTTTKNVKENDTIVLSGDFERIEFYIDKVGLKVIGKDATIRNGRIIVSDEAGNNTVSNLTISTTGYENAILNLAENSNITNNKVTVKNTDTVTEGIRNEAKYVIIANNTVNVEGPSKNINFDSDERKNMAYTFGIVNIANNTLIENNTVYAKKHKDGANENMGTIDAIEVQGQADDTVSNVTINKNIVKVSDGRFVYGINVLNSVDHIQVTNNDVKAESSRYSNGIQLGNDATNCLIQNNKVDVKIVNATQEEDSVSFGIIATNTVAIGTENITIKGNEVKLNASIGYAFEVYDVHNSTVTGNTINASGEFMMGIGISGSKNINVTKNEMQLNGNSTRTTTLAEYIPPANTGIHLQAESDNAIIRENHVRITDKNNNAKAVNVEDSNNVSVCDNDLVADKLYGNDAVINTGSKMITVKNNTSP